MQEKLENSFVSKREEFYERLISLHICTQLKYVAQKFQYEHTFSIKYVVNYEKRKENIEQT